MAGEFLYFGIYVLQQLGIMLGVGAQTVLLCVHLTAVHHAEKENPHAGYIHAARFALGIGLLFIFISGVAATFIHALNGQTEILLAPAFLFKWLLVIILVGAFFVQGIFNTWGNSYYAFTGGTWYALFLVHSLGPVTSWLTLWILYVLWLIFFSVVWTVFAAIMRWRLVPIAVTPMLPPFTVREISRPAPAPFIPHPAPPVVKPVVVVAPPPPPPAPVPPPPPPPPPKPIPPPPPPVPPLPPPKPVPPPPIVKPVVVVIPPPAPPMQPVVVVAPAVKKISWWRRLFLGWFRKEETKMLPPSAPVVVAILPTPPAPILKPVTVVVPPPSAPKLIITPPPALLPVVRPLSLSVPPAPVVVAAPKPVSVTPVAAPHPSMLQEVIDHFLVPALRIMPQKPEDIGKQNRPPVVKLDE